MPYWYYEKKELRYTPSIMQGMSLEEETVYRREGARFILQLGNKMGLRYETMATGVVYFHRFYMIHSFQEFPRHVTACCCLFLAGKVEETPKKCKDIMRIARALVDDSTWAEFGADPREEVMTLERIILQTIKFDFIVEHPYTYLLKYAKCLKGDKKKLQNMVQMAWTFVNDGLCTTLCLQWEPEIIAIALMYLAGKLTKFEVVDWQGRSPKQSKWWDMFVAGISMELLEDICHQVLDLYSPNKSESASSKLSPAANAQTQSAPAGGAVSKDSSASSSVHPRTSGQSIESVKPSPSKSDIPKGLSASVGGPPPSKKKKEDIKTPSPCKPDTQASTSSQQQPLPYSYNFPPSYPPSYPPSQPAPSNVRFQQYPYNNPAPSGSRSPIPTHSRRSPVSSHSRRSPPNNPPSVGLPIPSTYSTPTNRYPSPAPPQQDTSASSIRPQYPVPVHPSRPSPHYASQNIPQPYRPPQPPPTRYHSPVPSMQHRHSPGHYPPRNHPHSQPFYPRSQPGAPPPPPRSHLMNKFPHPSQRHYYPPN